MEVKMMKEKKIKLSSMVFFGLCAVLVLYTIAVSASKGFAGVTIWAIMIPLFLIPNSLIVAELGAGWPENGGIYVWTKRAFGGFIGSQVSWLYWANTLFSGPLGVVSIAGIFCAYFLPGTMNITQMFMVIGIIWFINILGIIDSQVTQKVVSYGGTVLVAILVLFSIGGLVYAAKFGFANELSIASFTPDLRLFLTFAPVVVFNVLGLELLSSVATRMDKPEKNVPKAILITGFILSALYILGSIAVLAVIPQGEINTVSGVSDAITIIIQSLFGEKFAFLSTIIVVAILYNMLSTGIGLALGTSYVISTTGLDSQSKILGHYNKKYGTPDYAYIINGVVATIYVLLTYLGGDSLQSIFWVIFSFASMVFLTPYLAMFPAVIKLRYSEADHVRPYKIPGGMIGVWICGILATLGILGAIIGFAIPPEGTENVLAYEAKMWGGYVVILLIGVALYFNGKRYEAQEKQSGKANIAE
jgi:amino acid transporter